MKFWTVQKRAVLDKVLKTGYYQPNFEKSGYAQEIEHLDGLYGFVLQAFNKNNRSDLPGLIFAFAATDNEQIYEFLDIEAFHAYMCDHKAAIQSLWKKLAREDVVILELEYEDNFNPLFIDINDFQFLMPPVMLMPPYTQEDPQRLINLLDNGQVAPSLACSGIMQAHLPFITRKNLLAAYEMFPLE